MSNRKCPVLLLAGRRAKKVMCSMDCVLYQDGCLLADALSLYVEFATCRGQAAGPVGRPKPLAPATRKEVVR